MWKKPAQEVNGESHGEHNKNLNDALFSTNPGDAYSICIHAFTFIASRFSRKQLRVLQIRRSLAHILGVHPFPREPASDLSSDLSNTRAE